MTEAFTIGSEELAILYDFVGGWGAKWATDNLATNKRQTVDRLIANGFLELQPHQPEFVSAGGERFSDLVQKQWPWAFKIGLLVILLVCSMAAQPGFAKGGKSTAHGYGKSAARPSGGGAKQTPQSQTQGPAKADATHTPVTRKGDKPSDIDTRITVQPRRLGKSVSPNAGHVNPLSLANPNHQRTLSALPRAPYSPARNAIGLSISPRPSVGPGYGLPPNGLRSVRPLVSPAVPNNATGRVVASHPTPSFVSPRGAINGTGLASRHQGPPQIGRVRAVAGINGTTIRPVH